MKFGKSVISSLVLTGLMSIMPSIGTAQSTPFALGRISREMWSHLSGAARSSLLPHLPFKRYSSASNTKVAPLDVGSLSYPRVLGATQINSRPGFNTSTQSETSIAVWNSLIFVGFNNIRDNILNNDTGVALGHTDSANWQDLDGLPLSLVPGTASYGDPAVAFDQHGTAFYAHIYVWPTAGLDMPDEYIGVTGRAFANNLPFTLPDPAGTLPPGQGLFFPFNDKPHIAIDNGGSGRIPFIWPETVYLAWTRFADEFGDTSIMINKSIITPDYPYTFGWFQPTTIATGSIGISGSVTGANIVVDQKTGALYVFYERYLPSGDSEIDLGASTDAGNSFTTTKVADVKQSAPLVTLNDFFQSQEPCIIFNNDTRFVARTNEFPSAGIDSHGKLYVAFATGSYKDTNGNPISNIAVASNASGSWKLLPPPNPATSNPEYMPWMTVSPRGVHVAYYMQMGVNAIAVVLQTWQNGQWSPPVQMSDQFPACQTNPNFQAKVADAYMGDYLGLTATMSAPVVYAAWGQNQPGPVQGGYQPDVFFNSAIVPAVPTITNATRANGTAALNWSGDVDGLPGGNGDVRTGRSTRFNVKRATATDGPYTVLASNLSRFDYTDTGLTDGVTYYYTISASNDVLESANSTPVRLGSVRNLGVEVSIQSSGLVFNRAARTFAGTITVRNVSTQPILGPLQIVLSGMTPGVSLANASGVYQGAPYITAQISALAPGASMQVPIAFANPANARIGYTVTVYSGTF